MKPSAKIHKHAAMAQRQPSPTPGISPRRWILIGLGVLITAGASWAFMEFVVWNQVPAELVGAWEVVEGPPEYREAVFEFYRGGKMVGRLNDKGNLSIMNASVRVEENTLYITTRRSGSGAEHVSVQTIRTLNKREFVVADERGNVMRLARVP